MHSLKRAVPILAVVCVAVSVPATALPPPIDEAEADVEDGATGEPLDDASVVSEPPAVPVLSDATEETEATDVTDVTDAANASHASDVSHLSESDASDMPGPSETSEEEAAPAVDVPAMVTETPNESPSIADPSIADPPLTTPPIVELAPATPTPATPEPVTPSDTPSAEAPNPRRPAVAETPSPTATATATPEPETKAKPAPKETRHELAVEIGWNAPAGWGFRYLFRIPKLPLSVGLGAALLTLWGPKLSVLARWSPRVDRGFFFQGSFAMSGGQRMELDVPVEQEGGGILMEKASLVFTPGRTLDVVGGWRWAFGNGFLDVFGGYSVKLGGVALQDRTQSMVPLDDATRYALDLMSPGGLSWGLTWGWRF